MGRLRNSNGSPTPRPVQSKTTEVAVVFKKSSRWLFRSMLLRLVIAALGRWEESDVGLGAKYSDTKGEASPWREVACEAGQRAAKQVAALGVCSFTQKAGVRAADSDQQPKRLGWSSLSTLIFDDISCCCCSVMPDSLRPHRLQHSRFPYPSLFPGVCWNLTSIKLMMPSNHLILCHPVLLLLSVCPSIKVFSRRLN